MKVVVLTPNYPRKNALMNGHFIHQQIKALIELGVDCHVILTYNWFPPFGLHKYHTYWRQGYAMKQVFFESYEGVPIHHVPVKIKMPSRFFPENAYVREANAIINYIRKTKELQNADWVYANFLTDSGYIGTIIKKKLGIKLAAIARGDDVHEWPEKNRNLILNIQDVYRFSDLLFSNSRNLGEDAKKWFPKGFSREVIPIYNGINTQVFKPIHDDNIKRLLRKEIKIEFDEKIILCVATPVKEKGWLDLFDAVSTIRELFSGWKIVAITPPRFNNLNLNIEANNRDIGQFFFWLGSVAPKDMPKAYQIAEIFVLPSHNEGISNALLEALASGIPVITTAVGGHGEILANNLNALVIKPGDVNQLANALKQLIINEELRNKFVKNSADVVNMIGSYRDNALRLYNLLKA